MINIIKNYLAYLKNLISEFCLQNEFKLHHRKTKLMLESKIGSRKVKRKSTVKDEDLIQIIRRELEEHSDLRKVFTFPSEPNHDFGDHGGI